MMHILVLSLLMCQASPATAKAFLGYRNKTWADPAPMDGVLNQVLATGHSTSREHLLAISARASPLFQVLPKNADGRVSLRVMNYMVSRYFRQWHGWQMKGFEPWANKTDALGVGTMYNFWRQSWKSLEGVMHKSFLRGGFALQDAVLVLASIQRLIFDEVINDVMRAYSLNDMPSTDVLMTYPSLSKVLITWFVVQQLGRNFTTQHDLEPHRISRYFKDWPKTSEFIKDTVHHDVWEQQRFFNPFDNKRFFGLEDITRIAGNINEQFGSVATSQCQASKAKLAELDKQMTGRVKLADFYWTGSENSALQFYESLDYLKSLGAIDTSSKRLGPQVMIANYMTGLSQCLSSSPYYSICCPNECDVMYQHLEDKLQKPHGSASGIAQAVQQGIPSSSVFLARNLSVSLLDRLNEIASKHQDKIPLHGRLFAQWLHFAFPHECPFPYKSGTLNPKTPGELRKEGTKTRVSPAEVVMVLSAQDDYNQDVKHSAGAAQPLEHDDDLAMWTSDEELLESASSRPSGESKLGVHTVFHITILVCLAAAVLKDKARILPYLGIQRKPTSNADGKYTHHTHLV